jgi:predicted HTH transcriptional regulator
LDDLIVGASLSDPSGKSKAGKSYVVFGKTDNTAINLSAIASGTGGFVIIGENEEDLSGSSVSTVSSIRTNNQIIQAIAIDITCSRD